MRTKPATYFICGTDTGVGKTWVTAALSASLYSKGYSVGVFKPAESGCRSAKRARGRSLVRHDSAFLKKMSAMPVPIEMINPYAFRETLAPGVAARREGRTPSIPRIKKMVASLQARYHPLFIEGAGGLLVPFTYKQSNAELIHALKLPVIVIARLGLGTINHTLLTMEALTKRGIKIAGVILNQTTPSRGLAEQTNPKMLRDWGVPIIGIFPYVTTPSRHNLIRAAHKSGVLSNLFGLP